MKNGLSTTVLLALAMVALGHPSRAMATRAYAFGSRAFPPEYMSEGIPAIALAQDAAGMLGKSDKVAFRLTAVRDARGRAVQFDAIVLGVDIGAPPRDDDHAGPDTVAAAKQRIGNRLQKNLTLLAAASAPLPSGKFVDSILGVILRHRRTGAITILLGDDKGPFRAYKHLDHTLLAFPRHVRWTAAVRQLLHLTR